MTDVGAPVRDVQADFDHAHDTFRDELASVHKDGRRKWIYARQPHGRFYRARTWVAVGLLAFLVSAPFIHLAGEPLVLLNVLERRFVFFGVVFWPQDFYLVVVLALTGLVTLALTTTAVGRVWCGWACPQTIFMEMVFRRLEYLIEGSAARQVRLAGQPWAPGTVARRVAKHVIFFALSFAIANLFLAYIIGWPALRTIITDPIDAHVGGLVAITVFSLLFYGVFARFREQVCTLACPYGRVMSALIDPHTLTVTYDRPRGEPRGRLTRQARTASPQPATPASRTGDCVDCEQCVTACPTGIDIRNGIQLECINCTACMDACDDVMTRLSRPRGLIRWTSDEAIRQGRPAWITARVKAYAAVWLVLVVAATTLLARRPEMDVLILRQAGSLSVPLENGAAANFYTVQIINRTRAPRLVDFQITVPAGATVTPLGLPSAVPAQGLSEGRLLVQLPAASVSGASTPLQFEVRSGGAVIATVESVFLKPGGVAPGAGRGEGGRP